MLLVFVNSFKSGAAVAFYCFPACDYLGERMASFFGITSAKYQYAIDEYHRMKKEVC